MPDPIPSGDFAPFAVDSEHILEPYALTIEGKAVARLDKRVFFLDHALPGQRVRARVSADKGRFIEARTLEVLREAPGQVAPFCAHFGRCGGCDWQDLDYAEQLRWKRQLVEDALTRIGRLSGPAVRSVLESPRQRHFRNKVEFAFGAPAEDPAALRLGLRQRGGRTVVEIGDCPVAPGPTGKILAAARRLASAHGLPAWPENPPGPSMKAPKGFWRFLVVRATNTGQLHVQCITAPHPRAKALGRAFLEALMAEAPEITGASHSLRAAPAQVAYGEKTLTRLGEETLFEQIGPLRLALDPDAFFQTNSEAARLLYEEIARLADLKPDQVLWDLYCGVGGIALFLAPLARQVLGFEISVAGCAMAEKNGALNALSNCRFLAGDVRRTMTAALPRPDVLVADPPRAGLHPDVAAALLALRPRRIIHVGCDPAAQARDVGTLTAGGYRFIEARPIDMFPHVSHVESVVLLERAD